MSPSPKINWGKVDAPEAVFERFASRRSVVYGTKGVVSSSQPLATEAGLEILRRGGNAADAAVATSAALNVTEPSACGIGGDAFCLFFDAETKEVKAFNGSGRSPAKLTLDYIKSRGVQANPFQDVTMVVPSSIPATDLNSVTVPGCAAAWVDTVAKLGSGKLTLKEVLEPAIRLAEEGVPVSEINSRGWQRSEKLIKYASPNAEEMLLDGRAPLPGEVIKLPNLARTFRELAENGKDGFYKGRVAEAIVELVQSKGGKMQLEDLAKHDTEFVKPISYTYNDEVTVYECPPNGQGLCALIALGIVDNLENSKAIEPVLQMEHNSPQYLHILIEALRLGFADSQWYITDPAFKDAHVDKLLSKEYLQSRAKLVDPTRTNPQFVHGSPMHSSDTVYFTVTDQWGNACSYIQSNYAGFGTGAVPKGCGFTLQNRGSSFVLDERHPNCLEGGKRPYHTIIPALATRGDELFLSYGVMGGFMQPQGHVQVLFNILRGFTPQAALDAPRFCIAPPPPETEIPGSEAKPTKIYVETGFSEDTINRLRDMGHNVEVLDGFIRSTMHGRGQVIQKLKNTSGRLVWAAGSDLRGDGHAAAHL